MPPFRFNCWLVATIGICLSVGCDREIRFRADALLHAKSGLTAEQSESIDSALAELFGTPDVPRLPDSLPRLAELIDLESLEHAAGPVISHTPGVTQGLYRRHCARCHGITGDGRGPTAIYQAPYPRDFRRGVFKWKSTYRDTPPTPDDLLGTIEHGVAGTAMPSFRLIDPQERQALRDYVVYLAVRGQAERELVAYLADEAPVGEPLDLGSEEIAELLGPIVDAWADAPQRIVAATATEGDIALGRELYHSERAGCYKCHGREGQGGAVEGKDYQVDHDLWTRDRLPSDDPRIVAVLKNDLAPRPSMPRRLIRETPHGGTSEADLFRRIHQGVAGSPMPAVGGDEPNSTGALNDEEIAAVVAYTQTLLRVPFPPKEQGNERP